MDHCLLPGKLVVDRLAAGRISLLGPYMKAGHVVEILLPCVFEEETRRPAIPGRASRTAIERTF